ncbi:MAG: recombinase RecA [Clostridiales bacterium]|jgi:recombination protein RecA|nr:recombinase RecA [Clostridiales bacterium]
MESGSKRSKKALKFTKELGNVITNEQKQKAIEMTIAEIEKTFGKGSIMKLGDDSIYGNVSVIPTGAISLDIALGVGGIPRGRIIEVYGPESSGKTTIALHIVAEAQERGGICGYVDAEHALDPLYAKKLGVDINELYISQPDDGEQALEIAEAMVRSCAIDLVIIDSVAALTPRAEIEGAMGESHMGLQARLMSQALRKLTSFANKTNCTILFINQLRQKIGNMPGFGGPTETTTGGRALKFYASIRMDIRRVETIKVGDEFVGNRTRVKIAKNKVAPPFKVSQFDIMYGEGISKEGDALDLAVELNLASKSGSWYSLGDERLGQGRENAKAYLKEHSETYEKIVENIREHYGFAPVESLEDVKPDARAVLKTVKSADKTEALDERGEDTEEDFDDIVFEE